MRKCDYVYGPGQRRSEPCKPVAVGWLRTSSFLGKLRFSDCSIYETNGQTLMQGGRRKIDRIFFTLRALILQSGVRLTTTDVVGTFSSCMKPELHPHRLVADSLYNKSTTRRNIGVRLNKLTCKPRLETSMYRVQWNLKSKLIMLLKFVCRCL